MENMINNEALFTTEEARVIACLMEKQLATPNNYPLTLNSLVTASNQKSNREPVMKLTEGEVGHIINLLAEPGYISIEYGERAYRVFHRMRSKLTLEPKQQAVLTVLMLRKPQTLNDIKARTSRMADFSGTEEIEEILEGFMNRETPLALCFPAGSGRREDRYAHTLCGEVTEEQIKQTYTKPDKDDPDRLALLEARIADLEERVRDLEERTVDDSGGQHLNK